jgi:hypothetical protein
MHPSYCENRLNKFLPVSKIGGAVASIPPWALTLQFLVGQQSVHIRIGMLKVTLQLRPLK